MTLDFNALRETPLFGGLSDGGLIALHTLAERCEVAAGAVLFVEGDAADALFVIQSGRVQVLKNHDPNNPDARRPLVTLGPRDFFGEMGFADMQARAGTVIALEPTVVWRFPYLSLRQLYVNDIKSYTLLVMNIARELSRRLRRADSRIVRLEDKA